jgi:hypothetical protein
MRCASEYEAPASNTPPQSYVKLELTTVAKIQGVSGGGGEAQVIYELNDGYLGRVFQLRHFS